MDRERRGGAAFATCLAEIRPLRGRLADGCVGCPGARIAGNMMRTQDGTSERNYYDELFDR